MIVPGHGGQEDLCPSTAQSLDKEAVKGVTKRGSPPSVLSPTLTKPTQGCSQRGGETGGLPELRLS